MGRILAIDYGNRRTGLAVTDPGQRIASPLETVRTHGLMAYLEQYLTAEQVDMLVVGYPTRMDGSEFEVVQPARYFVQAFKKKFPGIRVEWMDERFTSKMARDAMLEGGMRKGRRMEKDNLDRVSASLILQTWLERRTIRNNRR